MPYAAALTVDGWYSSTPLASTILISSLRFVTVAREGSDATEHTRVPSPQIRILLLLVAVKQGEPREVASIVVSAQTSIVTFEATEIADDRVIVPPTDMRHVPGVEANAASAAVFAAFVLEG